MPGSVILVTGGTGLVGKGIQQIIETEPEGSRFGKKAGEKWIFAGSSEGDLKWVLVSLVTQISADSQNRDIEQTRKLFDKYKPTHVIHLAALGK